MLEFDASTADDAVRALGRRFIQFHPNAERALLRVRDWYARGYVRSQQVGNSLRYLAPPDPYRLIEVSPAAIEHSKPLLGPKFQHAGEITGGDWDQTTERFEEMDVYRAYEQRFEDGVPWEETAFFDRIVDELESGAERWGCQTRAQFEERCRQLDSLYETIATAGYQTQAELLESSASDPIKQPETLKTERLKDEIAVNIGRHGEILFTDGRNRLSIAKLLGLDAVPVRVLRRHKKWQAVRDAYVRGEELPDHLTDHPDLVGQSSLDIVLQLVGQLAGRTGIEIRLVFDGDQSVDPVGIRRNSLDFDFVAIAPRLHDSAIIGPVNRLPDVSPRVAGVGQRVAVKRPLGWGVADDVKQIGVEFALTELLARSQCLGVGFDDNRVPATLFRAELAGDKVGRWL